MTGEERLRMVLARLGGGRPCGGHQHAVRCPTTTHGKGKGDRDASLRVNLGDDGETVVLFCNAGCSPDDICAAAGLTITDLGPERTLTKPTTSTVLRRHDYHDRDDNVIAVKVRRKTARGRSWAWERPDGSRGLDGAKPPLYRLPEVLRAVQDGETVYVAEGERDADTLAALGNVATTAPYGAGPGKKWRPEWTEDLRQAVVAVVADRDEVGISFARLVADELSGAGCLVRTLVPPEGPHKDITEMIDAGLSIEHLVDLTDDLDLSTPAPERRYLDDGRPAFVMVAHYWWRELDPHCCQMVLALADQFSERVSGRVKGRNKVATLLGWSPKKATTHLRHLHDAGIITVKTGEGRAQGIITLVNPCDIESRQWGKNAPPSGQKCPTVQNSSGAATPHRSNSRGVENILGSESEVKAAVVVSTIERNGTTANEAT